ncbi:MAG: diguanylate cyclase domain-containing protein [Pseudomonadales bacterium]
MDKLVSLFSGVLDAFIAPQYLESGADKVRSRALVGLLLANLFNLFFIALALRLFYPFTADGRQVAALACLTTVVSLVLALLLVRYTRWHGIATHLLILSVYVPIVLAACFTGGINSPVTPVLVWMPIVAGFLFNWKLGLVWLSVALLTAVGFFAAPRVGIDLISVVPAANVATLRFAMLIFSLVGIGGFIIVYTLINYHVVSELSGERREYERLANFDALTSLPNRMNFHNKLELAIQQAKRAQDKVGLLVMDLNKFKSINDTYGHSVGDELLHHMASRLIEHVRGTDFVARLSGDEFVVIMEHVSQPEDVATKAKSLINVIEQPYGLSVGRVKLGVSIGGAVYPDQEVEETALFSRADLAMFYAKKRRLGFYMDVLPANGEDYITQLKSTVARNSA